MTEKKDQKSKPLSEKDAALWKQMTGDVKRLPEKDYVEGRAPEEEKTAPAQAPGRERAVIEPEKPKTVRRGKGLDRHTEQRLRRGQMDIDATLDLHGMKQAEAEPALQSFLQQGYEKGHRCVLVITGKGNTRREKSHDWMESRPGVLRRSVPAWLARPPLADMVLQVSPARPKHGGEGALYVLLRRRR